MAVSTTTTLNDITQAAAIELGFMGYVMDYRVIEGFMRKYSLIHKGSAVLQIPSLGTNLGTVNDGGTSYATAYDGTEGTDLSTALSQTRKTPYDRTSKE